MAGAARAEPRSPVPRLDRAGADAQVHGGPGVRVWDGTPVARVRDMAVGPRLPAVDPVRNLVRRFRQRRRQRPLLGLEHGTPGPVAFPERTGIALVQPCADGGEQFVQRSERTVAHHAGQRHGRVPCRVLRGRLVLRPAHAPRYHRGGMMLGHGTVRVVEHGLAFARMADHSGPEAVARQPRCGASEPFVHRDVAPQPRVLAHVGRRLHGRVPAVQQHADEQVRPGPVARDRVDDPYGLAGPVLDPARHTGPRRIRGVLLAETVATHARSAGAGSFIGVFAMQDAQRHADAGELAVDPGPVGLFIHAFPFAPCRGTASNTPRRQASRPRPDRRFPRRPGRTAPRPHSASRFPEIRLSPCRTGPGRFRRGIALALVFPYHVGSLLSPHVPRMVKGA